MQTILGANGTIGSLLAKELTKYTNNIRLVSRHPQKVNSTDELLSADLSNPAVVDNAIRGSDVVYLLVGFEYKLKVWRRTWPALMRATIAACIKHDARLVFFDNMYLYDKGALGNMTEESPVNPPSKKGEVRAKIAKMLTDEVEAGRLKGLIARSADFYGPDNKSSLLIELVYKNLQKGKRPNWLIDLNKKHSFTFTPDAARATALLGNSPEAYGQVWHLPTDPNTLTASEMIALFSTRMNVNKKPMVLPLWMVRFIGLFVPVMREMPEMMYQYDRDYVFNSSKFEKKFGIRATPYADGVRETIVNLPQDAK